jgi:hypothetical protein
MIKIKIDSIDQAKVEFGVKFTLVSGKNKYSFFNTKKDGSNTKAYEQFKKFGFQIGDEVEAEVKEEERSFPDTKTGKMVKYTQRTIIFFNEIENTPMVTKGNFLAEPRTLVITNDFEARLKRVEDAVFGAKDVPDDNTVLSDLKDEEGIKASDIPF